MKKGLLLFSLFLFFVFSSIAQQNRNATVKVLNNYVLYSNANITALTAVKRTLESYNGLFNSALRHNRKIGGEQYEKPKPSPFLDEDVFYMNEDNPDFLYSVALKESAVLPATVKTELNNSMKAMRTCSQKLVLLMDSMSNIFSGPLIDVTKNENALPYRLLAEARRQLQESKKQRDRLSASVNAYYNKACPLTSASTDYIHSVEPLRKGVAICQSLLTDLSRNDSTNIARYTRSLDSLRTYLEKSELTLLKGIKPIGNSKQFPNRAKYDGFDLYQKYENIVSELERNGNFGKKFIGQSDYNRSHREKFYHYHTEMSETYNNLGLLYYYNEYVLLIGGGKMKIDSEMGILMRGWSDGKNTLPVRTLLFWMKETPRFEIEWPNQ